MKAKKLAVVAPDCVACGTCVIVCPKAAITVAYGVRAVVDELRCVGCSLCARACPADVIRMAAREVGA